MICMKECLSAVAGLVSAMALATPVIPAEDVSCAQDPETKLVTVSYKIGTEQNRESAIVTVDFETNVTGTAEGPWISIGAKHFRRLAGDVNRLLAAGPHVLTWHPDQSWPNRVLTDRDFRVTLRAWTLADPPDYLVCWLAEPHGHRYYDCEDALPEGIGSAVYRTDRLVMRRIRAAGVTWPMGAPSTEVGRSGDIETQRFVTLSKDYYIGVFPVTVGQYNLLYALASSEAVEEMSKPQSDLSWNMIRYASDAGRDTAAQLWPQDKSLVKDSTMDRLRKATGLDCDFPTAAQWEFACRAGTTTPRSSGAVCPWGWVYRYQNWEDTSLESYAWYNYNAAELKPVGLKDANAWGLYDMQGLVYEFCLNWEEPAPSNAAVLDPIGPQTGSNRVACGAAWNTGSPYHRSAYRMPLAASQNFYGSHILGFRLAAPLPGTDE